eukprot:GFKZ01003550.1.p1 GENE.GFKZ01003550.1~~GFKZ01003550.1.p1  ORF type:complete len:139 (+),score=13.42 GFKZ01003550.1:135-551(+)
MERRNMSRGSGSFSETRTTSRRDPYRDDEIAPELYDTSQSRFSEASLFRRSPSGEARASFPWRTCVVAMLLFGTGVTFLLLGFLHFRDEDLGLFWAFVVIGGLCFLPGGYLVFNLVQWMRGVAGFDVTQFAHWDDYRW